MRRCGRAVLFGAKWQDSGASLRQVSGRPARSALTGGRAADDRDPGVDEKRPPACELIHQRVLRFYEARGVVGATLTVSITKELHHGRLTKAR